MSGDRRWTPEHVGLSSSLHQATRSKKLVKRFHNACHIISFLDVGRVDTAFAKHTLSTMNAKNGTVIPVILAEGCVIHFTADNKDINEGALDEQNTFHATQYAAWQRSPESVGVLQKITPTKRATLEVPDEMNLSYLHTSEKLQQNRSSKRCQRGVVQAINPGLSISFEGSRNGHNIFP